VTEFDCEGCGLHVLGFGARGDIVPANMLCGVCDWLEAHEPPETLMLRRRQCEPGAWESERQRRLMPQWLYDPE
jgi:hypothetical protein